MQIDTIARWLKELNISIRNNKERHKAKGYIEKISGKNHPNYKDGKRVLYSGWGYKVLSLYGDERNNHRCDKVGRIQEHIYVMENFIGRKLNDNEVVHHVNFYKNR